MARLLRQCAALVALTGEAWIIREVFHQEEEVVVAVGWRMESDVDGGAEEKGEEGDAGGSGGGGGALGVRKRRLGGGGKEEGRGAC